MPIQRLAALAHQSGALLLVDGAQAPGSLAVTLHDTDCDIYTVSAHKWMLAPPGSGVLYINSAAQDLVRASFLDADTPPDPRAPGSCRMAVLCRFLVLSVSLTWEASRLQTAASRRGWRLVRIRATLLGTFSQASRL